MKNIIEIVKSLEDSSFLPEEVSETIQTEAREQRGGFLRYTKFKSIGKFFNRKRNKQSWSRLWK